MSKRPNRLDWFNWNPIVPGLILAWWLRPLASSGWDFGSLGWFRGVGLSIMVLWFGMAIGNVLSGGKLLAWMYSNDDDDDGADDGGGGSDVPASFAEFENTVKSKLSSPLMGALRTNLPAGGDLEEALDALDEEEVTEEAEAMGVLAAYRELCLAGDPRSQVLLDLLREPGSPEVFGCYYRYGMPMVHGRLQALVGRAVEESEDTTSDLEREEFRLLATLVGYAYVPAFPDILGAAHDPRYHDSYMWGAIFDAGSHSDEDFLTLIKQLGADQPTGFACVAYIDRCNQLCLEHELEPHPFSSDAGVARMRQWLTGTDPEHFSYASSATTAIPLIGHPARDSLLELAERHPASAVAVEAAWAGAKLGRRDSVARLAEFSGDWETGARAMRFMRELDLGERIPAAALEPAHVARCEVADWLQHPHELAHLPETLEILDHREIFWPPLDARARVTLVKWTLAGDAGVAMAGGTTTWCFFSKDGHGEPPLDTYARHCNWQLRAEEFEGAPEDDDDLDYGRKLLRESNPAEDWSARPVK